MEWPVPQLFAQQFVRAQIKENINAKSHWPLWGEYTSDQWIPLTKGQLHGKCLHLMMSSCSQGTWACSLPMRKDITSLWLDLTDSALIIILLYRWFAWSQQNFAHTKTEQLLTFCCDQMDMRDNTYEHILIKFDHSFFFWTSATGTNRYKVLIAITIT